MEETHKSEKALFGFWIYLMTDLLMFAGLFATYAVLHKNTFGGPGADALFDLPFVLKETLILLTSSFTCGLAMLAVQRRDKLWTTAWFGATFALGVSFLVLELGEFSRLVAAGNSWTRSAFLSSYFSLVGMHGLHITFGLLWIAVAIVHVWVKGLREASVSQLTRLSLFWHFLDVVWIFIFSVVYLLGVGV